MPSSLLSGVWSLKPDIVPIICHQCQWQRWQIFRQCRWYRWQFATGVNNTSGTGGKICRRCRWYRWQICRRRRWHRWCTLTCEYLREFSKKFEMTLGRFSGAWGKVIHEKTWSKKSSDTVPLNSENNDGRRSKKKKKKRGEIITKQ